MYFVCVYPGCKTLLPKVVACEGSLIMMTGSLSQKKITKKKNYKKKKKKRGCSLIRACSLIRSNTVFILPTTPPHHLTRRTLSTAPTRIPPIHPAYQGFVNASQLSVMTRRSSFRPLARKSSPATRIPLHGPPSGLACASSIAVPAV